MTQEFSRVEVDRVKSFWDNSPCNIRHSPKSAGTREYFDEVEARKYFVERHIPHFAGFREWQGKKVLEIGCGIGTDTINFARHGASVTAVELSERSLEIARRRSQVYGLQDRIRFYQGDAERLSEFVPVEPYDLIYSFGVIHHTPNPGRVIAQMRRYAHPRTRVRIMVYNRYSWKVLWILFTYGKGKLWCLGELVARYSEAQTGCPVTYTFTKKELTRMFASYGFDIKEMAIHHIFPYKIPEYVKYKYVRNWYFRYLPPPVFRWVEKHMGWHICLDAGVRSC